ncbi:MAG TPA: histidinol-phosphatase HisJ family protein [Gemmatimonadota bacterium]|jgi:histidinol-phosphatase (PHP family)
MPRVNLHCHDAHSSDASGTIAELAAAAASRGIEVLCVTNHVERILADGETWDFDIEEARPRFGDCLEEIERRRADFPGLELLFGAELEYRTEWREGLEELSRALPFDFLLGSVHVVDGLQISGGPTVDEAFAGRTEAEVYGLYFEKVLEMVRWGGFDTVSHLDLVKRFGVRHHGPFRPERYARVVAAIFQECVRRGIGIEVNASGLVAPSAEPMPGLPLLAAARRAGVPFVTLGTDGHAPRHVDRGLAEVEALAREAGFNEVAVFRARSRFMTAIGPT